MATFRLLMGLPASGKSYYANRLENFEVISSDNIREEVFGDINDQSHNNEVFNIMFQRTKDGLMKEGNICYDATNLSAKRRMNLLKELKSIKGLTNVIYECIVFTAPYHVCCSVNRNRERVVPEHAMLRMYKSFEPPHKSEGWDKIIIQDSSGTSRRLNDFVNYYLIDILHNNPHHTLTIGEHMQKAATYYLDMCEEEVDKNLANAIFYHDIGKLFTKDFHNSKGEFTEVAHYYNHHNVGAYLFLSNSINWDTDDALEIANLIFHHMDFFLDKKYLEKVKARYGEDFFKKLEILHEADLAAH